MADHEIKIGDVLTLPFFAGEAPSEYDLQYEVESLGPSAADGAPEARLIMLCDGEREKTKQGHFRRTGRSIEEIRQDLEARA